MGTIVLTWVFVALFVAFLLRVMWVRSDLIAYRGSQRQAEDDFHTQALLWLQDRNWEKARRERD
jgi:hypothetical protein